MLHGRSCVNVWRDCLASEISRLRRTSHLISTRLPMVSSRTWMAGQPSHSGSRCVALLTRHQLRSRLFLVPFAPIQQQILVTVPAALRVVIYRRLMLRIAERIAREVEAHALVTGDCVGQVASQTVENLAVIGSVV